MKLSLHPCLESLLSKNFIKNNLPGLVFNLDSYRYEVELQHSKMEGLTDQIPIQRQIRIISKEDSSAVDTHRFSITQSKFMEYWTSDRLTAHHRKSALCFFTPDLIELVNKTNSRLLYRDLLKSMHNEKDSTNTGGAQEK